MNSSTTTTRRRAKLNVSVAGVLGNLTTLMQPDKVPTDASTDEQTKQWVHQGNTIVDALRKGVLEIKALPILSQSDRNSLNALTEDIDSEVAKFQKIVADKLRR